jgi:hypothetical protein
MQVAGVFVDAIPVDFDHARWLRKFELCWRPESPAHTSYHSRIVNGPPFSIASAEPTEYSALA